MESETFLLAMRGLETTLNIYTHAAARLHRVAKSKLYNYCFPTRCNRAAAVVYH